MSKIKDDLLYQQDLQMQYYGKFMDFIYDNFHNNQLNESEINKLEEDQQRPSSVSKHIVSEQPLNNSNSNHKKAA